MVVKALSQKYENFQENVRSGDIFRVIKYTQSCTIFLVCKCLFKKYI